MTACDVFCQGKGDGHGHLIVCRPRFTQYIVRAHIPYRRKYEIIKRTRSRRMAFRVLAETMADTRKYNRGDVLGDEGPESYYEPMQLAEMTR